MTTLEEETQVLLSKYTRRYRTGDSKHDVDCSKFYFELDALQKKYAALQQPLKVSVLSRLLDKVTYFGNLIRRRNNERKSTTCGE